MSLRLKKMVQDIFNGYGGREIDELVLVVNMMIRDLREERTTLDKVKLFFARNRGAIEALMESASMDPSGADEVIGRLVSLVAREASFSLGGLVRMYTAFSAGEEGG